MEMPTISRFLDHKPPCYFTYIEIETKDLARKTRRGCSIPVLIGPFPLSFMSSSIENLLILNKRTQQSTILLDKKRSDTVWRGSLRKLSVQFFTEDNQRLTKSIEIPFALDKGIKDIVIPGVHSVHGCVSFSDVLAHYDIDEYANGICFNAKSSPRGVHRKHFRLHRRMIAAIKGLAPCMARRGTKNKRRKQKKKRL